MFGNILVIMALALAFAFVLCLFFFFIVRIPQLLEEILKTLKNIEKTLDK